MLAVDTRLVNFAASAACAQVAEIEAQTAAVIAAVANGGNVLDAAMKLAEAVASAKYHIEFLAKSAGYVNEEAAIDRQYGWQFDYDALVDDVLESDVRFWQTHPYVPDSVQLEAADYLPF